MVRWVQKKEEKLYHQIDKEIEAQNKK